MSGEPRSARQSLRMLVGEAGAYYQANLWQKLAESEEDLLEHRTDGSDAFSPIRSKLLRGRYTLYRMREIPFSRYFLYTCKRGFIKTAYS